MMKKIIAATAACLLFTAAQAQHTETRRQRNENRREQEAAELRRTDERIRGVGTRSGKESGNGAQELQMTGQTRRAEGARMKLEQSVWDFGDVERKGGDLVHDFQIENHGTTPLVVTRVITSCSCLKAAFPKRPVPAGGAAVIRITYEPHKNEPGMFHKVIQVYSNSVDGRCIITVRGNSLDPNKM